MNRATPPDAKILVLGHEPRCFYLERSYLLGDHAEVFSPEDLASAEALLHALREMGVSHLLLHSSTLVDMDTRSGAIETRLADLQAAGRIGLKKAMGSLTLWEVVGEGSQESR